MAHIAIYARQSVDKKDSLSIEGQIELCRKECIDGAEIKIYEDKGYSGKNTCRPSFEKLMRDVEAGNVSKLVCYRLDRISRNIMDFGRIWETMSAKHVEFVSTAEKFDTSTSIGKAMLYIIMIFAQMERETIAQRIRDNYYQRVKKGVWPGGPAPYGYELIRCDGQCMLRANEKISVVCEIFKLYSSPDASLRSVAKILNEREISNSKRSAWDNIALCRLLRQPAYACMNVDIRAYYFSKNVVIYNDFDSFDGLHAGIIVGKRTANERKYTEMSEHLLVIASHEGIIDSDTFLRCQVKLDGNRQIKNTGKGKYTWLSGLLKCGECGYSLKVINDKKMDVQYLTCSGRTNLGICKHRHSEKPADVEAYVLLQLCNRVKDFAGEKQVRNSENTRALDAIKIELAKTEDKICRLVTALSESSTVTMQYINAEISKLDIKRKELSLQISEQYHVDEGAPDLTDVNLLDDAALRMLAKKYIKKVLCMTESTQIEWT